MDESTIIHARPWCIHYSGMHNKSECEKGVRFDSLPNHGTKEFMSSCPCFSQTGGCEKAEYPTPEQQKKAHEEINKRFDSMQIARKSIVDACGGPWKRGDSTVSGAVNCPVCCAIGSLRFSRAGYNGHVHASCTTEGCISWME